MRWLGRLLCRLGFHWFKPTKLMGSLIVPCPMDQCSRPDCGIYRQFELHGYSYYTKESVETAAKDAERKRAERAINEQFRGIQNTMRDMGL